MTPRMSEDSSSYFNSIKVRLEHTLTAEEAVTLIFQFHKGTISTNDTITT